MNAKRSDGQRARPETAVPENAPALAALIQGPAANSFLISQRMALEAARFWARRLHAYADQMETLARCSTPDEIAAAQTGFFERMRDDYAKETQAIGDLITPSHGEPTGRKAAGEP